MADAPTNILGADIPPEGPANPGVPRGYICEKCPDLIADIREIKTGQQDLKQRLVEIRGTQKEIFTITRTTNGNLAVQEKDVAVLRTSVRLYVAFIAFVATPLWAGLAALLIRKLWG